MPQGFIEVEQTCTVRYAYDYTIEPGYKGGLHEPPHDPSVDISRAHIERITVPGDVGFPCFVKDQPDSTQFTFAGILHRDHIDAIEDEHFPGG